MTINEFVLYCYSRTSLWIHVRVVVFITCEHIIDRKPVIRVSNCYMFEADSIIYKD